MKILKKIIKTLFILLLIITITLTILNFVPFTFSSVKGNNPFRTHDDYPLIIPHGGAKDLAPENTIYAYEMLVNEFEADVLEIDLALTKDNVLIAHHDLDLEFSDSSSLNGQLIKDYTYQEIIDEYQNDDYYLARQFKYPSDYKQGIAPFVDENDPSILENLVPADLEKDIFQQVGDSVLYILEIKDSPSCKNYEKDSLQYQVAAQTLIDLVYDYNLENNVVLASFSDDVTSYFNEHAPEILIGAANDEVTNFTILSAFHVDFFWNVQSEVLILPNMTSMSPITGSTANLLDKMPSFIRDNIGIKTENGDGYHPHLTHQQLVNDAHRKNMAVIYWTINDPAEMKHLVEIGADGIITDRPDLLQEIILELQSEK